MSVPRASVVAIFALAFASACEPATPANTAPVASGAAEAGGTPATPVVVSDAIRAVIDAADRSAAGRATGSS